MSPEFHKERERVQSREVLGEIMTKNGTNVERDISLQIQEAQQTEVGTEICIHIHFNQNAENQRTESVLRAI